MIVLADADLERAANAAVTYGLNNSGQVCISVERIYVEDAVHDEFLEQLDREGRGAAPGPARRAGLGRRRRDHLPAADRPDRGARRRRGRQGRHGRHRRQARRGPGPLLRADRARRRRPLDALHDRGDVRPDAAGDARRRRRAGDRARQRRAATACRRRSGPATTCAARRSRAGSRPVRPASTTPRSTTRRSSCRWAAGRSPASARATAPDGIRKYTKRQSLMVAPGYAPVARRRTTSRTRRRPARRWARRSRRWRPATCSPTPSARRSSALCDTFIPSLDPPEGDERRARLLGAARRRTWRSPRGSRSRCCRPSCPTSRSPACAPCSTRSPRTGWPRRRRRRRASRSSAASASRAPTRSPGSRRCAASPRRIFYALPDLGTGRNPNWDAIGYPGPAVAAAGPRRGRFEMHRPRAPRR